ncbi:MAG: hypothetical protein IKI95_02435 [Clostridia bacterium]|nr:hypothetical protein [Clostridia bacterium]
MDIYQIFCIILLGICLLLGIVFGFVNRKYSKLLKSMSEREVDQVNIKKGVRYTEDQTVVDEDGNMNISFGQSDVVLQQNITEVVGPKNKVKPGKYTLLSSKDEDEKFNLRVGAYVKEYKHNQKIVLAEGQEITAVNCTVILR